MCLLCAFASFRKQNDHKNSFDICFDRYSLSSISLLAGTDESPGQTIIKSGRKVKIIRGMAGFGANMSYRQRRNMKDDVFDIVPEGVEAVVPYRGSVASQIKQLIGGLCRHTFIFFCIDFLSHYYMKTYKPHSLLFTNHNTS
jgi:hypothetical protein